MNYRGVFVAADNTKRSIYVSLYSMLRIFNTQEILTKMLSGNTIAMRSISREKTAGYVIVSDEKLHINSPSGSVSAGFGIYDTIRKLKCDVSTVCVSMADSMGAFLLSAGTKGKRYALENSQVMIHQVLGGAQDPASDILIESQQMQRVKERLNMILAKNKGHTAEELERDTDRNNWMFAEDALEYGIIDHIISDTE